VRALKPYSRKRHHVGAQTRIERRLVGNGAGPIESAEVGIRYLVSSLHRVFIVNDRGP
jgi:hypothetical protein